jgi:transcriptional regulator with XRE-family HTH domain
MYPRDEIIPLIRAGRALLNLSQDELATKVGVSRSVIARLERNEASVSLDSIDRVRLGLERAGVRFMKDASGKLIAVGFDDQK